MSPCALFGGRDRGRSTSGAQNVSASPREVSQQFSPPPKRSSGVGTGEKVLVSCLNWAMTIFMTGLRTA